MKPVKLYLYFLFFIIVLLAFNVDAQTQDFHIGSYLPSSSSRTTYYQNYWQVKQLGLNSVFQKTIVSIPIIGQDSNFDSLMQFNTIIAANDSVPISANNENNIDWIYYFTNALYSKWEAEGSPYFMESEPVGVKHNGVGYQTTDGWSCGNSQADTGKFFILGPNYSQYMKYVYTNKFNPNELVNYETNFRIKLAQSQTGSFPVAKLIISVKNMSNGTETTLVDSIIYSNQLTTTYKNIICEKYNYSTFQPANSGESNYNGTPPPGPAWYAPQSTASSKFYDENLKIQFKVQKLAQAEIIVDYIEVYDAGLNSIWESWFIERLQFAVDNIFYYNQKFTSLGSKLKYYHTIDEPHSIDCFYPIRKVQSILDSLNTGRDLLTHFYPGWDNNRDGVNILEKWYKIVQPKKLMFWYFPFTTDASDEFGLRAFRGRLKEASILQNEFYSTLQTWGYIYNNNPYWYRTPTPNQIGAEVMLALSSGAKGIFFEPYYSYTGWLDELNANLEVEAIVGKKNAQGNFPPRDIYFKVQQLNYRLNGKLGSTLSKLKHTNHFVNNTSPNPGEPQVTQYDYFQLMTSNNYCDWYAGFMYDSIYNDKNYFLLTNLRTEVNKTANFSITNNSGFANLGIFDVEDNSGTINTTLALNETRTFNVIFPAGEGYLFQVAPVVKYGGKLVYNEDVGDDMVLLDDMTIESGATLTVYGNYYAKANITVKNGGKIENYENGKIIFDPGKMLIIEGNAEIKGTSSANKLSLQFSGNNTAVLIKPGSSLTMDYCNITGAYQGIVTETGARSYVNISYSNILATYCGISLISGSSSEDLTSQIYKCNLSSTLYGISASNYNLILIKENTLTGCSINISNSSSAFLQGNVINGSGSATTFGIFMSSSTGYVRSNTITNCLNGLHLANSSPDVGGNILQGNIRHGIYIGSGSIPNLVGYLQLNPPLYFPLSGYNKIYSNGSATSTNPIDNDGSEIYLTRANILLSNGCNQISDDRTSTPTMNTQYLISGSLNSGNNINAIYNYWGTKPITSSRFKNLNVTYAPYYTENCPLPDGGSGGGGSETFVLRTSTGLIVDTLVAAEGVPENYSTLQVVYSEADNQFATGNVTQAKPLYEQIIAGSYTTEEKLSAYNKLYTIGNLTGADENYFTGLQNTFDEIANAESDTLIKKVYQQNAIKCDISKDEYITAINKFDNIIQENPNSEEAVYAEIDIITTALNLDTTNSGLGKIGGGKYLVKGTSDYLSKLNDILQSKFGINSEDKKQIIPKEYSLHQNYPNPFNPSTTIKFDIPDVGTGLALSNVTLKVYDILGREVATLVDEFREAGVYEITFDASKIASGVYVYKLQAGDFVSSKKMVLLK